MSVWCFPSLLCSLLPAKPGVALPQSPGSVVNWVLGGQREGEEAALLPQP